MNNNSSLPLRNVFIFEKIIVQHPMSNGPCSRVSVDIRVDILGFLWISKKIFMLARITRQGYSLCHGQRGTDIHK